MTFDPTDKKYQVTDEFPPDKGSEWKHPKEENGWMLAHNALRYEMRSIVEALEAVKERGTPLAEWESLLVNKAWKAHEVHVHAHHHNEDSLFVPQLKQRFKYPEQAETDHVGLLESIEKIGKLSADLKEGGSVDDMLKEVVEYEKAMLPHLLHEEEECLPLTMAYFTPDEIGKIVQKILSHGPKVEMGSFIVVMGIENFRNKFMVAEGIPGFVWYIDFKSKAKYFQKEFVDSIDALKSGKEPVAKGFFAWLFGY